MPLGTSTSRVGATALPRAYPFLNGADLLASPVPSGSDPDGVVDVPVHDHLGVDAGAGSICGHRVQNTQGRPQQRSLGARRLQRGFPAGSLPDNSSAIVARMESAVHFPWFAELGSLQWRPVQTGPAHVGASPTTPPAKWLPATPLVAPTENIRVFPRCVPTRNIAGPHTSKYSGGASGTVTPAEPCVFAKFRSPLYTLR